MSSENTLTVTSANFDKTVLQSLKPVLIDFWAPWCGPCKALSPILEQIAQGHQLKVTVVKVNVDEEPELAKRYAVRGIPTIVLVKNGEAQHTKVGMVPLKALEDWLLPKL